MAGKTKYWLMGAGALVIVAGAALMAVSNGNGKELESELDEIVAKANSADYKTLRKLEFGPIDMPRKINVKKVSYDRGIFSSEGVFEITGDSDMPPIRLEMDASHGPLATGGARYRAVFTNDLSKNPLPGIASISKDGVANIAKVVLLGTSDGGKSIRIPSGKYNIAVANSRDQHVEAKLDKAQFDIDKDYALKKAEYEIDDLSFNNLFGDVKLKDFDVKVDETKIGGSFYPRFELGIKEAKLLEKSDTISIGDSELKLTPEKSGKNKGNIDITIDLDLNDVNFVKTQFGSLEFEIKSENVPPQKMERIQKVFKSGDYGSVPYEFLDLGKGDFKFENFKMENSCGKTEAKNVLVSNSKIKDGKIKISLRQTACLMEDIMNLGKGWDKTEDNIVKHTNEMKNVFAGFAPKGGWKDLDDTLEIDADQEKHPGIFIVNGRKIEEKQFYTTMGNVGMTFFFGVGSIR